jgi:uncharacterized membrane protein
MTDTAATPPPAAPNAAAHGEGRTVPAVVYGLYLLGLTHGLTMIIGLVIAYASMGSAGPKAYSHYLFLVRTVWTGLAWAAIGCLFILVGLPLTLVLIGFLFIKVGVGILALGWLWVLVRCIVGIVHLSRDEAYPRPRTWLI